MNEFRQSNKLKALTVNISSLPPTSSNFTVGYCSSGDFGFTTKSKALLLIGSRKGW